MELSVIKIYSKNTRWGKIQAVHMEINNTGMNSCTLVAVKLLLAALYVKSLIP